MAAEHCVFVVVDREYGERVCELVRTGPVWVVDTPTNRSAAQKVWAERPDASHLEGVTTFKSEASSPEDVLIRELDTIDLHHGVYSADPQYTILEVVGASVTERVKTELAQYGFDEFCATATGFRAIRSVSGGDI
jgi:hypothetical protein